MASWLTVSPEWLTLPSRYAIPLLLVGIPLLGVRRKVAVYEAFVEGAREGLVTAYQLAPYLLGMLVAIRVFQESGAMDGLTALLTPVARWLGLPSQLIPLALIRPLSGSGSLGLLTDIFQRNGPDSLIGRTASAMQGSTETTFYILAVYFGAAGVRDARYAPAVGLLGDFAGFLGAVVATRLLTPG